jgi:hypothetical protein
LARSTTFIARFAVVAQASAISRIDQSGLSRHTEKMRSSIVSSGFDALILAGRPSPFGDSVSTAGSVFSPFVSFS